MKYAYYGWIIDTDHIDNGTDNGVIGPRNIDPDAAVRLKKDPECGERFRMYDDDGELYYSGRILFDLFDDTDGYEVEFAPLDDFGMPNAGCTEIRYWQAGKWVTL